MSLINKCSRVSLLPHVPFRRQPRRPRSLKLTPLSKKKLACIPIQEPATTHLQPFHVAVQSPACRGSPRRSAPGPWPKSTQCRCPHHQVPLTFLIPKVRGPCLHEACRLCMCMRVCVLMGVRVCVCMCVRMLVRVHVCMLVCMAACVSACVVVCVCMCVHVCMPMCACACLCV